MTSDEYAKAISETVRAMLERNFLPCILIGLNMKTMDVIAQSIDPKVFGPAVIRALVCKVVVGDILGEVPAPPPPEEGG
jgi:hypothetical protein